MLSKQIARKRGTAFQTIKVHRGRVMQKMQAKTVAGFIRFVQKAGLMSSLRNFFSAFASAEFPI
jgi:FixJ family two-component response regulator